MPGDTVYQKVKFVLDTNRQITSILLHSHTAKIKLVLGLGWQDLNPRLQGSRLQVHYLI